MTTETTTKPTIRPDVAFREVTHERYWEMLEILWPACDMDKPYGFLVGEPWDHGRCTVTGATRARYSVFLKDQKPDAEARFFEGDKPITLPEFRKLGDNGARDVDLIIACATPLATPAREAAQ